jgi:hypothetical protein
MVPIAAYAFALIVFPLLIFATASDATRQAVMDARPEPRIFWPAMEAFSVLLAVQGPSRFSKITWPPPIVFLLIYLAFAGASVLWAFNPERSFVRFLQQAMIVTSIVLPTMLACRTADLMRGVFFCSAMALILNVPFVLGGAATIVGLPSRHGTVLVNIGYQAILKVRMSSENVPQWLSCSHFTKWAIPAGGDEFLVLSSLLQPVCSSS